MILIFILLLIFNYILTISIIKTTSFTFRQELILLIPFITLFLLICCSIYIIVEDIYYDYFWRQK